MYEIRCGSQVAALMREVEGVHARLGTLSEFNYRMSEEDIRLSWTTMDYPTVRMCTDVLAWFRVLHFHTTHVHEKSDDTRRT